MVNLGQKKEERLYKTAGSLIKSSLHLKVIQAFIELVQNGSSQFRDEKFKIRRMRGLLSEYELVGKHLSFPYCRLVHIWNVVLCLWTIALIHSTCWLSLLSMKISTHAAVPQGSYLCSRMVSLQFLSSWLLLILHIAVLHRLPLAPTQALLFFAIPLFHFL